MNNNDEKNTQLPKNIERTLLDNARQKAAEIKKEAQKKAEIEARQKAIAIQEKAQKEAEIEAQKIHKEKAEEIAKETKKIINNGWGEVRKKRTAFKRKMRVEAQQRESDLKDSRFYQGVVRGIMKLWIDGECKDVRLAEATGVGQSTIQRFFKQSREMSLPNLCKVMDAAGAEITFSWERDMARKG